jgi:Uma2 family endonuclease
MAPTERTHGALHAEVAALLGDHLRAIGSPCSVIIAGGVVPAAMAAINMRVPDIAVTCTPYVDEAAALSNPVLLAEILSPGNTADTWANVWAYTTLPSAREILILHTQAIRAEILRRRPDGAWPEDLAAVEAGDLELTSIGFRAPLTDLYATTRLAGSGGKT